MRYELAEGRILKFCGNARTVKGKACVLVIDEINRADRARIFGELMYLLEYRDREILLSGVGAPFSIPSNIPYLYYEYGRSIDCPSGSSHA